MNYHSKQNLCRPTRRYWGFLGCRFFLLPTSNSSAFRIGNSGKFTDKGPCIDIQNNAKSPIGMTDLKNQWIFGGIGKFYCCRLQILANLSGKHFGWKGSTFNLQNVFECFGSQCALHSLPPPPQQKNYLRKKFWRNYFRGHCDNSA